MRVLSGKAAERVVAQLEQRASRLDEVEPAVRQDRRCRAQGRR